MIGHEVRTYVIRLPASDGGDEVIRLVAIDDVMPVLNDVARTRSSDAWGPVVGEAKSLIAELQREDRDR